MSELYTVSIKESVSQVVRADDRVSHRIDLLDLRPKGELVELLTVELLERGFEKLEDGTLCRDEAKGVVTVVDFETMQITTSAEAQRTITAEGEGDGKYWDDAGTPSAAHKDARRAARKDAERKIDAGAEDLQRELTRRLEAGEAARMQELHEALQGVYAEALKRQAASLGDVVEQHEGVNENGEYELVIRVEL